MACSKLKIIFDRISHACGVMNEDNGDRVVIIAGGESHWEQFSSETFTLKSGRSQFSEGAYITLQFKQAYSIFDLI